jgi:hypothetical protein
MAVQTCPKCGLMSPGSARRCDCGWDFADEHQSDSYLKGSDGPAGSFGLGFAIGFFAGCPGVVIVHYAMPGIETKRGAMYGFLTGFVTSILCGGLSVLLQLPLQGR